jgi:Fe-S cluster biogenesis protein NfuA
MTIDQTTVEPALEGARALVQADGGDLVVDRIEGTQVYARLVIEGAECAECVMPRQFLEQVALDMVRAELPDVSAITIDDPRES